MSDFKMNDIVRLVNPPEGMTGGRMFRVWSPPNGSHLHVQSVSDGEETALLLASRFELVATSVSDPHCVISNVTDDETFVGLDEDLGEIRVTNAATGGMKGRKLGRFALIPWEALRALARHYGVGAFKYDDDNWRKGYDWSLSADALERHWNAWRSGESTTVERFEKDGVRYAFETHHLIALIWQAITLYCFERWGAGSDDVRYKLEGSSTTR